MKKEIIISGFGGQGVMSIGKNLVEAGMEEGFFVTWAPSYGPEMRGGTANCHLGLSESPIGAPMFTHPTELIAMNAPSIEKFGPKVRPGGAGEDPAGADAEPHAESGQDRGPRGADHPYLRQGGTIDGQHL